MTRDYQQCGMCDQQRLRPACAYAQSDQSPCLSLEYSMTVKLLTEHDLDFLSLKGGCTGSSESTLVKMPHCWKSRHGTNNTATTVAYNCYKYTLHTISVKVRSWSWCATVFTYMYLDKCRYSQCKCKLLNEFFLG